jgi:hypothetical protein
MSDQPPDRPRTEAAMATEADEAELIEAYGMTSEQLADEAEAGYDPAKFVPYTRPENR